MGRNAEPARRLGALATCDIAIGRTSWRPWRPTASGPRLRRPPELVHEFVNDLYRFELRRLRQRQVRGEIPKHEYSRHVIALRKQYLLVSLPLRHWTRDA